jgi:hypothetical protein
MIQKVENQIKKFKELQAIRALTLEEESDLEELEMDFEDLQFDLNECGEMK